MKRFVGLASMILVVLTGSYFIYGLDFIDTNNYNVSTISEEKVNTKEVDLNYKKSKNTLKEKSDKLYINKNIKGSNNAI